MFNEIENKTDIIGISPTFLKGNYLSWTNEQHPGFLVLFSQLCTRLGLQMKEPKHVIYSNFWIGKYSVYKRYVEEIIKPAIKILEEDMIMEAFTNSQYKSSLTKEQLISYTGMDYFSYHTFLIERLLSVWLDNNPEISFLQIL